MRDGFRIADADRHVVEPIEMWRERLPPALREHAPYHAAVAAEPLSARVARLGARALLPPPPRPMLAGRPLYNNMSERAWLELASSAQGRARELDSLETPEAHLREMDREGIDVAVLFPTYALLVLGRDDLDPELALGFARAYNEWLRDLCARDPARLRGVALACPHAPDRMAGELDAASALGTSAVVMRPNPVGGRRLGHPAYAPFWAECERRSIGVVLHEGTHSYLPAAGADRFESRFALHACSHPIEQMMALLDLVEGGVLDRHPMLRVAFLEAGCGWLPYWLWRLDEEYAHLAGEVAGRVRMPPSAYFRRQCLVAAEPDEPLLPEAIRHIGDDRILFGTDFPHLDHDEGQVTRALALRGRVPDAALRKMLWDNAAGFFGLGAPQQQQEKG
ncbi:MAG TPA: amidohydrolase family protein [Kofleriaceae bacterium]|nr:amidohydrolase family protein [Kofleriaceae bacterium]